jgi:hypothetical protein
VFTPAGGNGRSQILKNSSEGSFDSWSDPTMDPLMIGRLAVGKLGAAVVDL